VGVGVNTYKGSVPYPAVAESQGKKAKDVLELL
jgi:alanine dehydrogenase